MNKEELQKRILRNTVRLQSDGKTIGSGILYVPEEGGCAYVLTVAHVFNKNKYPVKIQCYPDGGDDGTYTSDVEKQMVHLHDDYTEKKDKTCVQYCDAAVVEIPKKSWMADRVCVYYGMPQDHLRVLGYGYSGESEEEDIRADNVAIEDTEIRDVLSDCHRMRVHLKGNFSMNHADREGEIGGLSGTILAVQGQPEIVMVGAICNTNVQNALFAIVNVIDMTAFCEIFAKLGVPFERYEIELEESEVRKWKSIRISADRHFVCRNAEMSAIQKHLHQDKLVVLYGIGGIGKTELARYYAARHGAEYTCVQEVSCTASILEGIAKQVKISGFSRKKTAVGYESNEAYGQRKLNWILEQPSQVLFIFDDVSPEDPAWSQIALMNQDKIVTSRWSREAWNCQVEEIAALKNVKQQQYLFEQYLERSLEEQEIPVFENIAAIVGGHTLTLQLIALQCNAADTTLEEILEVLENQGIYTEDENGFSYGNTQEERNMYGHIRSIWNFSTLNEEEGRLMQGLCLLPERGITRTEYQTWMHLDNLKVINALQRRGWIQAYHQQGKTWFYLHTVISEVVYWELYRKASADLEELQWTVFREMKDRSKVFLERLRYISYGEYMGMRLPCSLSTVCFLLGLSMEEENLRELTKAMNILQRVESYLERLDALETMEAADCYNNIAVVYQTGNDLQMAHDYFKKASVIYQRYRDQFPEKYGFVLHNMARIHLSWKDYNEALTLENQAERWIRKGNLYRLGNIYDVKADFYAYKWRKAYEDWQKNLTNEELKNQVYDYLMYEWEHWDKAVRMKEAYCPDQKNEIMLSKANRACSGAFIGKYTEAKKDIQEVFEFYQKTTQENSIELGNTYSRMCLIYEKCGEYKLSCEYGEKSVHILEKYGEMCSSDLEYAKSNLLIAQEKKLECMA